MNVMAAAHRLGLTPCVQLLTTTYFNMWKNTLTEHSPLCLEALNRDPYSLSKRFAFLEGDARARDGQDIRFVIPGGAFGPSPAVERAMTAPSMNTLMVSAIKKEIDEIISFPIPWVYTDDCAWVSVAALEKGVRGERYIAHGQADKDVGGMDYFCNIVLEEAGSKHRVRAVPSDQLDNPDIRKKYGDSWADLGKTSFPKPWSDSTFTQKRLGYKPTQIRGGVRTTLDWMRKEKLI
jgi:nucleoside-diphosphate-sugar epimerase